MMNKKPKKIALLVGGRSSERAVSLSSGAAFEEALKVLGHSYVKIDAQVDLPMRLTEESPDLVLIGLHGKYAEDGTLQGLCEYLKIPYTGSGVLGSALCMDKSLTKKILAANGLPTAPFYELHLTEERGPEAALKDYSFAGPVVVKPARDGSSQGISLCLRAEELLPAVEKAARFDRNIIIESFLEGAEVTVPILGDRALTPIEIRPLQGFYDYENKYTSGRTEYLLPPELPLPLITLMQEMALVAHRACGLRGYSRVDFKLHHEKPFILEINTLPGMTPTSLLPKSAQKDGISFPDLVQVLIDGASLDYEGVD